MKEIRKAILLFAALSLLTGILYPALVTIVARAIFPKQAAGSLMYKADGTPTGSALIGQLFSDPKYFWPRPSATKDSSYNPLSSGGSNLGPTNKELIDRIAERVNSFRMSGVHGPLPADLAMASGSGLDPHISPEAAYVQIPRIANERQLSEEKIYSLVLNNMEGRQFGFLGPPRVNVLKLNLALDEL